MASRAQWALRLSGTLTLFVGWELYSRISDNRLIPGLGAIWDALIDDWQSGDLWFHGRSTLYRGLLGLGLALIIGIVVGVAMGTNRYVEAALEPILGATYPAPKLALYPVFILLFGLGSMSKIVLVALECFYPIVYNVHAGARSNPKGLVWHARNVEASRWRRLIDLTLPSTASGVAVGLRIAAPIMLVVMVVAELIGESRGFGFMIQDARSRFQPAGVYSVIVVLGIIGFIIDRATLLARKAIVFWEQDVEL